MVATIKDLRKAYEEAKAKGIESFSIEGFEFYTKFAYYLLEYLKMKGIPEDTPLDQIFTKKEK